MSASVAIAAGVPASATPAPALSAQAQLAARVMMRKSPETQRTYQGIYDRFAAWLADRDQVAEAPASAFTAEALVAYLDEREQLASPATVKKERAALRRLARYLHQLGLIDATVILMVEIPTITDTAPARQGLDHETWARVLDVAHQRLNAHAGTPAAAPAARDLALVQVLGGAGLRSGEARTLPADPYDPTRQASSEGAACLRVHGKGNKVRAVPLYTDVTAAIERWRQTREQIPQLDDEPTLFCRLGRARRDGSHPDAGGRLSTTAAIKIVAPIMLAAGVPQAQAHPHTLRHTFGRLYMAAPGAELSRLQRIMGHASPETTSRYVHHADQELAAEHRRIEYLHHPGQHASSLHAAWPRNGSAAGYGPDAHAAIQR